MYYEYLGPVNFTVWANKFRQSTGPTGQQVSVYMKTANVQHVYILNSRQSSASDCAIVMELIYLPSLASGNDLGSRVTSADQETS
jgi:hypothetical protein